MSRIHEALKKAAEERSTKVSQAGRNTVLDLTPSLIPSYSNETEEISPALPPLKSKERTAPYTFEELAQGCARSKWTSNYKQPLFENNDASKVNAERFRKLRLRLYQMGSTKALKILLITSSVPAEGKTFVTRNLGQSIVCQPDRRVLLIDADLRAPRLHINLGAPNDPGLTNYLQGETDELQVIHRNEEENLFFIPSGTQVPNPSELLLNGRMQKLLNLIRPAFDWVLIDSSPSIPVHDAVSLADLCDGVLFVVKAGATDYQVAEKAVSEFRKKNLLGVVLNSVGEADSYGNYNYANYGADSDPAEQ
jgi:capsular exopolysaccharide synthesis family protein